MRYLLNITRIRHSTIATSPPVMSDAVTIELCFWRSFFAVYSAVNFDTVRGSPLLTAVKSTTNTENAI